MHAVTRVRSALRDRFELILKIFHFTDNSGLPSDRNERKRYMLAPVDDAYVINLKRCLYQLKF